MSLAATNATARVQVQTAHNSNHLRIFNAGAATVFVEIGDVNVTATTTTSMPIGSGEDIVISCPCGYLAGITSSGTATLYLTPGEGL